MGTLKEDYYPYQLLAAAIEDLQHGPLLSDEEIEKVIELTKKLCDVVATLRQIQELRET